MSDIERILVQPRTYLGLRRSLPVTELQPYFAEALPKTFANLQSRGLQPASPPIAVWRKMDMQTGVADVHAGCFVADDTPEDGELTCGQTPSGEALKLLHVGPYSEMGKSWQRVYARAAELGRAPGAGWEVYVDDPTQVAHETLRTEIYLPLMPEQTAPRVRVYLGCSLDGCIAGPKHDSSFLNDFAPDPDAPPASLDVGLVDELTLTFLPVVLGQGVRLWDDLRERRDLEFHPPVLHGGRMVQVTATVRRG